MMSSSTLHMDKEDLTKTCKSIDLDEAFQQDLGIVAVKMQMWRELQAVQQTGSRWPADVHMHHIRICHSFCMHALTTEA